MTLTLDDLIRAPQFQMTYADKQAHLLPLLREQAAACRAALPAYDKYVSEMRFAAEPAERYTHIPYLPVAMFKHFELRTVPEEQVVRVLRSSATTSGVPSKIHLDKITLLRQSQGLAAIVMDLLGKQRRPFLVLDTADVNQPGLDLGARGAAVRGLMPFASSVTYGLRVGGAGLEPDLPALERFFAEHAGQEVLLFGFTYVVWMHAIQKLRARGVRFDHPRLVLLHSGGWKRLTEMEVDKATLAAGAAEAFGCAAESVRDFYGMVEQVGVIFVDCEAGHKHTPNFAEVAIRDFLSLEQVPVGGEGLIEVLSALPASYPGHGLLTEDVGVLLGYDDCPCGRKGLYFRFRSRVADVEVRGCGDITALAQAWHPGARAPAPAPARVPDTSGLQLLVAEPALAAAVSEAPDDPARFALLRQRLLDGHARLAALPVRVIVALLDAAAAQMTSEEFRGIEGIAFLATWLRRRNLETVLAQNFGAHVDALDRAVEVSRGVQLRAAPRGLVCHWVAGNVPTLAMFSWALATLGKNASIVRVSRAHAASAASVGPLFAAVARAQVEVAGQVYSGQWLLERTCVLTYPSEDLALNQALSLAADARVVWGDRQAVQAILQLPRLEHCEDVVFGPKFSLAVADAATVAEPAARRTLVQQLVRDVVIFEQGACSSPQILYVACGARELDALVGELEAEFVAAARRTPREHIAETTAARIVHARAEHGLQADRSVRAPHDLSYSILVREGAELAEAVQARTLFVCRVGDVGDVLPLLSPKIQTIGVAIGDPARRQAFAEAAAVRGVARCVALGTMNFYETPWDGLLPVSRLVRWARVG